jgi:hypothetical protein
LHAFLTHACISPSRYSTSFSITNYKTYFPWIQVVKTICFCRIGRGPNLWFHHSKAERCPGPVRQ